MRRGAGEQRPLELRIGVQARDLRRFLAEFGAPDQHEGGLSLLRQRDHRTCGHPARPTRADDDVVLADAGRTGGHLLGARDHGGSPVCTAQADFEFHPAGQDLVGDLFGDD
nr:hypothetical protein CPGR_00376 [Mycolicibacter nonchromogenicus]